MSFINKRVASTILRFLCVFSFLAISTPALSDDTTYYVRTNSNPYASPFFIFSLEPNGDSVELSLEKAYPRPSLQVGTLTVMAKLMLLLMAYFYCATCLHYVAMI